MRGIISILNFGSGLSDREGGDWNYENGIMMRGLLKKESINLATQLKEIHETPGGAYRQFIAEVNSSKSFLKGAMLSGSNIVGLMSRSAKIRDINSLPLFSIILKDGRKLLASTDKQILNEILKFEGVEYKSWAEIEKNIKR